MKNVGYARVSTKEQELDLQMDALKKEGVEEEDIFVDKISGSKAKRPGLDACLTYLQSGDTLLVWRLDRLGRSLIHLVSLIDDLRTRGIKFRSICDGVIDTTTASGDLIFNIFGALAQFERRLIQERTRAGLEAAKLRGRLGGRKPRNPEDLRIQKVKSLHSDRHYSVEEICEIVGVSRSTYYRYLLTK